MQQNCGSILPCVMSMVKNYQLFRLVPEVDGIILTDYIIYVRIALVMIKKEQKISGGNLWQMLLQLKNTLKG